VWQLDASGTAEKSCCDAAVSAASRCDSLRISCGGDVQVVATADQVGCYTVFLLNLILFGSVGFHMNSFQYVLHCTVFSLLIKQPKVLAFYEFQCVFNIS
jgi:hypothetical protein